MAEISPDITSIQHLQGGATKQLLFDIFSTQSRCTKAAQTIIHSEEQWRNFIDLHYQLLEMCCVFFISSQDVPELQEIGSKYDMPARLWIQGIQNPSMLLYRHRASGTLPHMRTFLNHACDKIALLYEKVPYLANTWMECMGDLARCGMAFEEGDDKISESWRVISRGWYSKLSQQSPATGRHYFHLTVVTTDDCLRRLFYYMKSSCAQDPFPSESDSVTRLFRSTSDCQFHEVDAAFVRAHIILSSGKGHEKEFEDAIGVVLNGLNGRIEGKGTSWQEAGCFMAIAMACSVFVYSNELTVLSGAMSKSAVNDIATEGKSISEGNLSQALSFAIRIQALVLERRGDENTLPFFHTLLVFLDHLTRFPAAMQYIEKEYPWGSIASMLNSLGPSKMERAFPGEGESLKPLPEDYAMQGLTWVKDYHPDGFFGNEISEEMKAFCPSLMAERQKRIISLGHAIATRGRWFTFDADSGVFCQ